MRLDPFGPLVSFNETWHLENRYRYAVTRYLRGKS